MIDEIWIIQRVVAVARHSVAFRPNARAAHQHLDALVTDLAKWTAQLRPVRERCREAFAACFDAGPGLLGRRLPDDHPAHACFDRVRVELHLAIARARAEALDPIAIEDDDDPYSHVEYEIEHVPPKAPDRWTTEDRAFRAATGLGIMHAALTRCEPDRDWPAELQLELEDQSFLSATVDAAWDRRTDENIAPGSDLARFHKALVSRVWYAQVHRDHVLPVLLSIDSGEGGIVARARSPIYFMNGRTRMYTKVPIPYEK